MIELKSCPFCGSTAVIIRSFSLGRYKYRQKYYVVCSTAFGCGGRTSTFDTEQDAAEAWNRRDDTVAKKYIDADSLNEWLDSWQDAERTAFEELRKKEENSTEAQQQFLKGAQYAERCNFEGTRDHIENMPAADVQEARRGEWRARTDYSGAPGTHVYCSVCGEDALKNEGFVYYTLYCPNCGAKMDGGKRRE